MQRVSPAFEPKGRSRREALKPVSVTVNDACRITGLGRTKVYELIADGPLKSVAIGDVGWCCMRRSRHSSSSQPGDGLRLNGGCARSGSALAPSPTHARSAP